MFSTQMKKEKMIAEVIWISNFFQMTKGCTVLPG